MNPETGQIHSAKLKASALWDHQSPRSCSSRGCPHHFPVETFILRGINRRNQLLWKPRGNPMRQFAAGTRQAPDLKTGSKSRPSSVPLGNNLLD